MGGRNASSAEDSEKQNRKRDGAEDSTNINEFVDY